VIAPSSASQRASVVTGINDVLAASNAQLNG